MISQLTYLVLAVPSLGAEIQKDVPRQSNGRVFIGTGHRVDASTQRAVHSSVDQNESKSSPSTSRVKDSLSKCLFAPRCSMVSSTAYR